MKKKVAVLFAKSKNIPCKSSEMKTKLIFLFLTANKKLCPGLIARADDIIIHVPSKKKNKPIKKHRVRATHYNKF